MVLQDKYKRANSSRYRATHGGIQSNRQKARNQENTNQITSDFPDLLDATSSTGKENDDTSETTPILQVQQLLSKENSHPSFARRPLATNLDRYLEPEPQPDQEPEPEVDLSNFIEKQRNKLQNESKDGRCPQDDQQEEDVDQAFNHLYKHSKNHSILLSNASKKPTKVFIDDPSQLGLEELDNERKKADATRELIARFSGQSKLSNSTNETKNNLKKMYQQMRFHNGTDKIKSSSAGNQTEDAVDGCSTPADLVGPLDDEEFLDEVLNDSSGTYGKFKRT